MATARFQDAIAPSTSPLERRAAPSSKKFAASWVAVTPAEGAGRSAAIVFRAAGPWGNRAPRAVRLCGPEFHGPGPPEGGRAGKHLRDPQGALERVAVRRLQIDIDGAEAPIMDGSSRPFVDEILAAGF